MDKYTEMEGIRLKKAINVDELLRGEGTTFEIDEEEFQDVAEENSFADQEQLLKFSNLECLGLEDEDTYNECPFEQLSKKMVNLLPDGRVKKRILREGVGDTLSPQGLVICDYNAYLEYQPEPFDSTYAFNRPLKFQLDSGKVLPGLEIAVLSMKVSEKSQYLVHPDLAYGQVGCLERVPENATILFEIEIKNCLNTGAAVNFHNLPEADQMSFDTIYDCCEGLRIKGNDLYRQNLIRQAIREYNSAVGKLERCEMKDYNDQERQQALLLKLYTNLVVAYTKEQLPRKACTATNMIFRLVKGTSLKVPIKVYFNSARALIMLNDFTVAEKRLKAAKLLEPQNNEIAEQLVRLNQLKQENLAKETKIAKLFVQFNGDEVITEDFKESVKKMAELLRNDTELTRCTLPHTLTSAQLNYIRNNIVIYNLHLCEQQNEHYICKSDMDK